MKYVYYAILNLCCKMFAKKLFKIYINYAHEMTTSFSFWHTFRTTLHHTCVKFALQPCK